MLLALDLGNSNITLGVFEGERLLVSSRLATDRRKMEDEYAIGLQAILKLHQIPADSFTGAIFSSVVPTLDRRIRHAVRKVTGLQPLQVGPGTKTGLNIRIDNPAQLGADLLVGAVAAVTAYGYPCMIWDLGTATKVSVVDREGLFRGGAIIPGVQISLDALTSGTSLLPNIGLEPPGRVIGANTVSAMQSGLMYGTAALIDGMCARIEEELGYPAARIATGGLGKDIIACCKTDIRYEENLLLEGLRLIYLKNKR